MPNKVVVLASSVLCCCTLAAASLSLLDELSYNRAQSINNSSTADELKTKLESLKKNYFHQYFFYGRTQELEGDLLLKISALGAHADEDLLEQAIIAFRSSIEGSPANGVLWIKFALSKALLKQFDPEFDNALQKAFEYNGWEAGSVESIIRIGLANPQTLDVESLLMVKESLQRLYSVNPIYTIDLARKMNQMHLACIWVRDMTPVNPWCQRELRDD